MRKCIRCKQLFKYAIEEQHICDPCEDAGEVKEIMTKDEMIASKIISSGPVTFQLTQEQVEGINSEVTKLQAENDALKELVWQFDDYTVHTTNCNDGWNKCSCGLTELRTKRPQMPAPAKALIGGDDE
jgi:hypothetical protein